MPADYLSRLPGAQDNLASISAFDPFFKPISTTFRCRMTYYKESRPSGPQANGH